MRRIRRVLVAVKVPAAKVLPVRAKAAQLARAFDAELVLFLAIATPLYLETEVARLPSHRNRAPRTRCLPRAAAGRPA